MKKFLIAIFFALITPSISNACESIWHVQNTLSICDEEHIDKLLKLHAKNPYAKFLLPEGMTKPEAIRVLKQAKQKVKSRKKYECSRISGQANNSWSASKIYRECMKK